MDLNLEKYNENIEFNRDTISNWEKRFERPLNDLQGDELEKFKDELFMKKMFIFDALVIFEDNGKYGVLTSRNEEEFALAINTLLSDVQLRSEYGSLSLECSKAYTMEIIGTQWLKLFHALKSNA